MVAAPVPSRGVLIAGKYLLRRPLASGGMGSVWVAHHQQLDIEVAVKFMEAELATSHELRSRFEREARAAAKLKTKHVVQIFDHGVDGELPYIAMELLEGEDLRHRLRLLGRLDLRQTAQLLDQIAKGLSQAHGSGVIHRDLKPANVFLTRIDDEEIVKLLDFGVAKMPSSGDGGESTRTGIVVGSPNYMSPEQARSTKVDHRTDLWSVAVILFRCVTGHNPFRGETNADVVVKVCAEPIPSASSFAPDLPVCIDAFFVKALRRVPAERFQSALEMAEAFAQAVAAAEPEIGTAVAGAPVAPPSGRAAMPPGAAAVALPPPRPPLPSDGRGITPTWGLAPLHEPPAAGGLSPGPTVGSLAQVGPGPLGVPSSGGTLSSVGTLTHRRLAERPRALLLSSLAVAALAAGGIVAAIVLVSSGGPDSASSSGPAAGAAGAAGSPSALSEALDSSSSASGSPGASAEPADTAAAEPTASVSEAASASAAPTKSQPSPSHRTGHPAPRPKPKTPSWGF